MKIFRTLRPLCRLLLLAGLLMGLLVVGGTMSRTAHAQAAATITVTTCDESHLDAAIASASSGDTINFACSGDIALTKTLVISQNLTLDGSGQNVTLDGQNQVEVLTVYSGVSFTLNALTIAHGNSGYGFGGGLDSYGTVTISNSTIANNTASNGGGLANNVGMMSINNSTIANNTATWPDDGVGGGISNENGTLNVSNSTFVSNSVDTGSGGGIDNAYQSSLTVTNSTFTGNSAGGAAGGGIDNYQSTATINNSTIATNNGTDGERQHHRQQLWRRLLWRPDGWRIQSLQ